jgi:nucleoside phosphorylase
LAEDGVRLTLALGARLVGSIERGEEIVVALAAETGTFGSSLSQEVIDFALANAGDAPVVTRANKLAFLLLSTVPSSSIAQLLSGVAARAFRRAGPAFGPLIDADDLLSLLRWKLWTLPADHFAPERILKHPGLAAYLSVIARRIVIDECRAMENRARVGIDPATIERSADPRSSLEALLDELDLLQRFATELPEWEAPLIDVLTGQVERNGALSAINHKRAAAGLVAWSADSMRTAIHRARKRLRDLLIRTPSKREPQDGVSVVLPEVHRWRRFWCSREGTYSLGDGGFLVDPETAYGRHVHDVVAIERLEGAPCLVLLGEPGIGKSTVIRQEQQRLAADGTHAVLVDLSRASSGDLLHAALGRALAANAPSVCLFLDALDEGLSRNGALTMELRSLVETLDIARVRLRIACRTLEWPSELEASLRQRYEPDAIRVQELLPLRRIDVISAANDHGIDGAGFVDQVRERDATALAVRPISLRFLLAMFTADGALPHSKSHLFDEGTVILCSEEGALQRGRNRRNPDVFRRRAIAARLAVASTFANRHTIVRKEEHDEGAMPASIAIGVEQLPDKTYSIDTGAVDDVLTGTALFTARGTTTFGWNHQSYREFLAAWYLAQHRVGSEIAEHLYFPSGIGRVPGPLREVAAWHATFVPALFDQLVERDPEVLLHSDGAAVSSESRAQLVRALLDRMARYEALDWYHRRDYQKLAHPQLRDQLRPYIADRSANIILRRAAMDIAWSCDVRDVIDDLTTVLVNREDDVQAREAAARALSELGGDRVRDLFLALLAAGFEPDPNDCIRGCALAVLWPDHIDAATLIRHLALPKRDDYLGPYQRFISDLPASLKPDQLVPALEWIESIGSRTDFHLQHAQHDIINRGLRCIDRDDVRTVVVRIIRASLRDHLGVWYADGPTPRREERTLAPRERRLLARDLIRNTTDDAEGIGSELILFEPPLLALDDLQWIAEMASSSADERIQRVAGRCVAAIYFHFGYPVDASAADAVLSVEAPAFQESLRPFLQPVELGSALARELATNWARVRQPPSSVPDKGKPRKPTLWEVASPLLTRIEAGDLSGWVEFVRWTGGLPKPISDHSEWAALAPHDRERVLIAALRYLQGADAPGLSWLDVPNEYPWTAVAARSALQLIAATRPVMLDALGATVWRKWCPVLVAVPFPTFSASVRADLIQRCAGFEELTTTILRVARRDNRSGGHLSVLSDLPEPLPGPLRAPLLQLAPDLQDDAFADVLERLLREGNEEARELARTAVREATPLRAARAARALLPHDATQWTVAIRRMECDHEFITEFAPLVAYPEDIRDDPFRTLSMQQAAELVLALLRQFPPDDDPRGPRGWLTLHDYRERLRHRLIRMLTEAGTVEAIRALEWLRDQEPGRETLRYILIEARQKLADATWQPLSIDVVKTTLITDPGNASLPSLPADAVPLVAPTSPPRRDVGCDMIIASLAHVAILVETATPLETTALHAAMQPLAGQDALIVGSLGFATYTIGTLGNYAVAHVQTDMGNESPNAAQLATNDAIVETRPKLLLQVGIAFGLQPAKQRLGDVLIAQHITSYEMVKLKPDSIEERGETMRADATLIERVAAHGRTWYVPRADGSPVAFHIGQVLSGAKLVNNRNFRDALVRRFPAALGGEMEGIGAYAAAFRHRVPVLLVKGICDWADGAKDDHAQPFAAFTAVELLRHVLQKKDVLAALGIMTIS